MAKWADLRKKSPYSFTRELVALGDFNMPKCDPGDPIYKALTKLGLDLPEHSTQIASSISSDANYDQIADCDKKRHIDAAQGQDWPAGFCGDEPRLLDKTH